jgi:hypothetical protein
VRDRLRAAPVLVGLDGELGELLAGLDHAAGGAGRLFLLAGDPGIGKSRLAGEAAARARDRGFKVATSHESPSSVRSLVSAQRIVASPRSVSPLLLIRSSRSCHVGSIPITPVCSRARGRTFNRIALSSERSAACVDIDHAQNQAVEEGDGLRDKAGKAWVWTMSGISAVRSSLSRPRDA